MKTPKPRNTTRLYAQNINGIQISPHGGDLHEICQHIEKHEIDNFGLIEHNLDQTKDKVKTTLHKHTRQYLKQSKLTIAGTPIKMTHNYKPGGTMTLTTGNMVGRLISTGTDDLGRWSRQSFHGKSGKRITILHVYQTPRSTIKPGQVTAAAQQYSLLRQRPGEQNLSL